jgi:hypothetical protein
MVASASANDGRAGRPLESSDAVRIPSQHIFAGEVLGLLADGIAGGDAVQAGEHSSRRRGLQRAKTSREPRAATSRSDVPVCGAASWRWCRRPRDRVAGRVREASSCSCRTRTPSSHR